MTMCDPRLLGVRTPLQAAPASLHSVSMTGDADHIGALAKACELGNRSACDDVNDVLHQIGAETLKPQYLGFKQRCERGKA